MRRIVLMVSCLALVARFAVGADGADGTTAAGGDEPLTYNRDIQPILAENCFRCHGPDKNQRQADLRLDLRDDALAAKAFVPGKPDESELIHHIFSDDPAKVMPPPDSNKKLTSKQKELLKRWIAEGATYQKHWSYEPPVKAAIPEGQHGVDFLVGRRLAAKGLKASPEADRRTLARRLSLDVVGLPPAPEVVERFTSDGSPESYARLVDDLLASPHFGERMALSWLDVVRFADTIGYHSDNPRNVYPYRDYVIRSFNDNKPFDQFTIEQLAGDLLPNATTEQRVASCFNKLLLTTEEGGAQAKDYEARMLGDRVRAVGTVWLGQTLGCCQCHDHKYDPAKAKDFYSLGAFFADIEEPIIGRREDGIAVPTDEQSIQLVALRETATKLEAEYNGPQPQLAEAYEKWLMAQSLVSAAEAFWSPLKPSQLESAGKAKLTLGPDAAILASGPNADKDSYRLGVTEELREVVAIRIEALPDPSLPAAGPGRAANGNFVLTEVVARARRADGQETALKFVEARASIEQASYAENNPYRSWNAASAIDGDAKGEGWGWAVLPDVGRPHQLLLRLEKPLSIDVGEALILDLKQQHGNGGHNLGKFRVSVSKDPKAFAAPLGSPPPKEIADLLAAPADQRKPEQNDKLQSYFKSTAPELAELRARRDAARKSVVDFEAGLAKCMVSTSMANPRVVRFLPRGNWMDESGQVMSPALPEYLAGAASTDLPAADASPAGQKRLNRLDLARWLVSRDNPLTARVFVNRLWKQFFGAGLCKSLDDLGAQGDRPAQGELLDYLACEFRDSGWNVKQLVRLIVTSQTYRQSSAAGEAELARDPDNRDLARQGRFRLDAELVRDNALAISGLLAEKIGGPSVKPYQPDGYWENLNFPVRGYDASPGDDQHRRGLYTWWQRSFLHPSMLAFDAPSREECAADRPRSNIPQQALVLLNDPTYVEAAKAFAAKILREGGGYVDARINFAWKRALQRAPRDPERAVIVKLLEKHRSDFAANPTAAQALLRTGVTPPPADLDPAEAAAWTSAARVILNLHETVTRN